MTAVPAAPRTRRAVTASTRSDPGAGNLVVQRHTGNRAVRGTATWGRSPTASAVHCSLEWFLEARLMYSKWTQGIEQVRRRIVVVNVP